MTAGLRRRRLEDACARLEKGGAFAYTPNFGDGPNVDDTSFDVRSVKAAIQQFDAWRGGYADGAGVPRSELEFRLAVYFVLPDGRWYADAVDARRALDGRPHLTPEERVLLDVALRVG